MLPEAIPEASPEVLPAEAYRTREYLHKVPTVPHFSGAKTLRLLRLILKIKLDALGIGN